MDSVVLLHGLNCLFPGRVQAIHVHHGLSPNADAWAAFCQQFCEALGIPLRLERVRVLPSGAGTEAAAREARYGAYERLGPAVLCLAHHRQDQVETLLFNLCRGAGVHGLSAMAMERQRRSLKLLRPLLNKDRSELHAYALAHGLAWIEDESNQDLRFSRNYLRHQVLPALRRQFPQAEASAAKAAMHLQEAASLLEDLALQDEAALRGPKGGWRLVAWCQLPLRRQKNLLRYVLRSQGEQALSASRLAELTRQLASLEPDGRFVFAVGEREFRALDGEIILQKSASALPAVLAWCGESELSWGNDRLLMEHRQGEGINAELLRDRAVTFRLRQGGEVMVPRADGKPRALKKLLQAHKLDQRTRQCLPLMFVDETLVWCPGVGLAAGWGAAPGQQGLRPVWVPA